MVEQVGFLDLLRATGGRVNRASTRPLDRSSQSGPQLSVGESCMRANAFREFAPDPKRVILQSMRTNPFVHRVVSAPARVAGMIDLYPTFGLRCGEQKRANPKGSDLERLAWMVWRQYVDDCGSQRNLIRREFQLKLGLGEAVRVRYRTPKGKLAYGVVANSETVLTQNRDGSWAWDRGDSKIRLAPGDVQRSHSEDLEHQDKAISPMLPLVELLATWELTHRALAQGVRLDVLLGGFIVGPIDPSSKTDWTDDYFDWLNMAKEGKMPRAPFPIGIGPSVQGDFKLLDPGKSIQDNLLALSEMVLKDLARFSPMDTQMILEGIGSGTHWNGVLMNRDNMQSFIFPTLIDDVVDHVITWPYRPALEEAAKAAGLSIDIEDWGVYGDWQRTANQPDQAKAIESAVKCGILSPETLVRAIGADLEDMLVPGSERWDREVVRRVAFGDSSGDEVSPSREPVGVGGEAFGAVPDHGADVASNPAPVQRASLVPEFDSLGAW